MRLFISMTVLITAFLPTISQAQVEARAGIGFPSGTVGGAEVDRGYGVGLNVQFDVLPVIDIYGAFSRYTLDGEVPAGGIALGVIQPEGRDAEVVDLAYAIGARMAVPFFGALIPWVKAGVTYDEVELKLIDEIGSTTHRSEGNIGYEAGGGLSFQISPLLTVTPGVLYHQVSPDFRNATEESDLSFWAIELGIAYNY